MIVKQLPYGVYDTDIKFVMGTWVEIDRYFWRHHEVNIPDDVCGRFMHFDPETPRAYAHRYVLLVTDRCLDKQERGRVLIHEIVHCALHVFESRGIRYSSKHSEPLAYFIEWMYAECYEVLTRR